jgi:uncharacterized membrane protein
LNLGTLIGTLMTPVAKLRRSVVVQASIDEVFEFWKNFSNFPRFMSHVENVFVNESGGLHWVVAGPAHSRVEWDARVTELITNQRICWRSLPNSPIVNAGEISFRSSEDYGSTQVDIELIYAPPAGALGYAVAHFLGYDPSDRIDEDLATMRRLIEEERERMGRMPGA